MSLTIFSLRLLTHCPEDTLAEDTLLLAILLPLVFFLLLCIVLAWKSHPSLCRKLGKKPNAGVEWALCPLLFHQTFKTPSYLPQHTHNL